MRVLIKQEMRLTRKVLLIWMGIVLIMGLFCYWEYLSLKDYIGEFSLLVDRFPAILRIMFGVTIDLTTALGWYCCIYYWNAVLVFSYAVYLGLSAVAGEKTRGTSEYLFTKPVRREQIVMAKVAANLCNMFILAVICGLCNYYTAVAPLGGLEHKSIMFTTTAGLFLTEVVLYALSLLISGVAVSYNRASRLGAGMLILFYCIYFVAELLKVPLLYFLTPVKYFDVCVVAAEGISIIFLLLAALITITSISIAVKKWSVKEL